MAGHQRDQLAPRLDQDSVYVRGVYDPYLGHLVGQGLPQICDVDFISDLQHVDVAEVVIAAVTSMPGYYGVRILSADRNACLGEDSRP